MVTITALETTDFSSLTDSDVASIALQRTQHLKRLPWLGSPSYLAWMYGVSWPLQLESHWRRNHMLCQTMKEIRLELDDICRALPEQPAERVIDIGCGHAFIDLLLWQRFQSTLTLIDIEQSAKQHHGYQNTGSGYASLASARAFLVNNGVPDALIATINPSKQALNVEPQCADIVVSLLSAGFHFPIREYARVALGALKPGGILVFDARNGTGQRDMLDGFAKIQVIKTFKKSERLAAFKP